MTRVLRDFAGRPPVESRRDFSEDIRRECHVIVADYVRRNEGRPPSRRCYYPTTVDWCLHLLDLLDAERAGDA